MQRLVLFAFGSCGALWLCACPGTLSNPEAFEDAGAQTKDAETILAESCGTSDCHDASAQAQAGLDLLSPNVEGRVVDVNATGLGCGNEILVVPGDPDSSYLLQKILNVPGICGLPMPVVGLLSAAETETIRQWIEDLGNSEEGIPDGG
jgi:hypothetical protein